ncbi:hypothetical protein [Streptococcus parauberis]|uniref:Uncharacterized protein n=1 Tax=Streptococcus parauberis NCFD 2020 TaxID=873447 RepID=F1Z0Q4_9STRE|nr:hypothetical protein [Streptococcus parauberis]EGE53547.1 hypothetical protein SPB_0698 [Streptococcus parauberis NCFD 2020]QBX27625.1 hypothetical protein Javan400_0027 [Streptococcus phage Javan400]
MTDWLENLLLAVFLFIIFSLGVYISNVYYQPQIDGLTKQLDRTQKQLKKVSEESADKTARIAELTKNGG